VNHAHLRFGHLLYTRVSGRSATQFRVPLDRLIAEAGEGEMRRAHLISVIGGDTQVAALHAAISGGDSFTIETPDHKRFCATLGQNPECYRGSLQLPELQRPLRHLVAVSEEVAGAGSRVALERAILLDDSPGFIWAALVEMHGLPGAREWAEWMVAELHARRRITTLQGIGCNPVLVKATRQAILRDLGRGLRRKQIRFPQENRTAEWPSTSISRLIKETTRKEESLVDQALPYS
jgi:hypothetical protein